MIAQATENCQAQEPGPMETSSTARGATVVTAIAAGGCTPVTLRPHAQSCPSAPPGLSFADATVRS